MKIFRLTRRQKLVRNLLVIALLVFWVEWCLGFPAWRTETLIRRAEQAYLLEPVTEIWMEMETASRDERHMLYGENNGQLIYMSYEEGILGKYLENVKLYRPEVQYIIYYQTEPDGQYVSRTAWVIGFLEEAERMELELTLQDVNGVQGALTLEGTKVDDHCFSFASTPEENRDTGILWLEEIRGGGVLRIYDCTDTLLEERTYDVLSLLADE